MKTKKCCECYEKKSLSHFSPSKCNKDGYRGICKQCRNAKGRYRYAISSEYRQKINARNKKYLAKHPKRREVYIKQYYYNHIEEYREWARNLYWANPEKGRKKLQVKYKKKKNLPKFRLENTIRVGIYQSLKENGVKKNTRHWEELVGYTLEQLKTHLESQFTIGMHWGNHGKWHIDHIRPISSFKYNNPNDVEFKMCWRLENLQPLWAKDNIRKSNKLVA